MKISAVRSFTFSILILTLVACGGNGGDPTSTEQGTTEYGGRLTMGKERANTKVSESNKLQICQTLNSEVYGVFIRALAGIGTTPQVTDSLRTVRISGKYAGYIEARGTKTLRSDDETVDFSFKMTFYDFSDSGFVFMGGEIGCDGYIRSGGPTDQDIWLILTDGLAFAGNYSGEIVYHSQKMPINPCGRLISALAGPQYLICYRDSGSISLISGDTRINFRPYFTIAEVDPDSLKCGCQ